MIKDSIDCENLETTFKTNTIKQTQSLKLVQLFITSLFTFSQRHFCASLALKHVQIDTVNGISAYQKITSLKRSHLKRS